MQRPAFRKSPPCNAECFPLSSFASFIPALLPSLPFFLLPTLVPSSLPPFLPCYLPPCLFSPSSPLVYEPPLKHVVREKGPEVADVCHVIHRWTAAVELHPPAFVPKRRRKVTDREGRETFVWSLQLWQLRVVSGYRLNMGYVGKLTAELVCFAPVVTPPCSLPCGRPIIKT